MRWIKAVFIFLFALTLTSTPAYSAGGGTIFIPFVSSNPAASDSVRTINIPYFNVNDLSTKTPEMAILWFGKVTLDDNYTDVRIGYNNSELLIRAQIFDRRLWYNPSPTNSPFEEWDSLAVTLHTNGSSNTPTHQTYRFVSQLYWWEGSANYKKAYQGNGSGFIEKPINFTTESSYRGNAPNDNVDDRGWVVTIQIPFTILGISAAPLNGTIWRLGFALYDRDSSNIPANAPKIWPENYNLQIPNTWGQLRFGIPVYIPPNIISQQTSIIREGFDGIQVLESSIGGGTVCGSGMNFWTQWGEKNYSDFTYFNIQNQSDVADWPCYSKDYLTFPTSSIPIGKQIILAKLTLYQFGNSDPSQAQSSYIQIMRVNQDWDVNTLNWNNAPLASQNYGGTWVDPLMNYPGDQGVPRVWDVSQAFVDAYSKGMPLRLVLYSSDMAYHSGKYFLSSQIEDWNKNSRPTITVEWGDKN